ncbi:MAG: hypothetical protein ABGY09_07085 [Euryarchaeota archaeon]
MTVPEAREVCRELFERKDPEAILEDLVDFAKRVDKAWKNVNPRMGELSARDNARAVRRRRELFLSLVHHYFDRLSPDLIRDALGAEESEVRSYLELDAILRALEEELEERREDVLRVRKALGKYACARTYVLSWLAVRFAGGRARLRSWKSRLIGSELLAEEAAILVPLLYDERVREWAERYLDGLGFDAVSREEPGDEGEEGESEDGWLEFGEDRVEPEPELEVCVVRDRLPRFVDPDTGAVVPDARAGDLLVVGETAARILSKRGKRWGGPFARRVR